jgi:hypothetical protein
VKHPFFRNRTTAAVAGVALFLAGSWCRYDAWEGRGGSTPRIFRPFTWW